jgi:membrane protease subunit HflK
LLDEYKKAPAVTRKRLYLETMQGVLQDSRKVVVSDRNGNNVLYMPLEPSRAAGGKPASASATEFVERLPAVTTSVPQREPYRDPRDARRSDREGADQ